MFIINRFGIIYLGSRPTIFIRDVDLLKRIALQTLIISRFGLNLYSINHVFIQVNYNWQNFFGDGISSVADHNLFFTNGEKWRRAKVCQT